MFGFFKSSIFTLFMLFFTCYPAVADMEIEAYNHLKAKRYSEAISVAAAMHEQGDLRGTYILSLMHYNGWGLELDKEKAGQAFFMAANNAEAGGVPDAAYYLARNYYLNPDSKYYNFPAGLRLLVALKMHGHKNATFYHGVTLLKQVETAKDPEQIRTWSKESFSMASKMGKPEADLFLFVFERDEVREGKRDSFTTIDNLTNAADMPNSLQHIAAFELALLYKEGKQLPLDLNKYVKYLRVSADLGNARAALYLGRALGIGMTKDPDYDEAKFYLEFAKKKGEKGAEFALSSVKRQQEQEQSAGAYQPPTDWFEHYLAAQAFSSLPNAAVSNQGYDNTDYSAPDWESLSQPSNRGIVRFTRSGDSIRGSDGSRYRINGDTVRASDGTRFRLQGDRIRASNGVTYKIRGNTIRGSDGTRCRMSGRTTRCF